jgi:hypothetical protein
VSGYRTVVVRPDDAARAAGARQVVDVLVVHTTG